MHRFVAALQWKTHKVKLWSLLNNYVASASPQVKFVSLPFLPVTPLSTGAPPLQVAKMFKCVVLYDVLSENFTLHPLVRYRGGKSFAVGGVSLKDSRGEEVNQVLQPGEAVVVKVTFSLFTKCVQS